MSSPSPKLWTLDRLAETIRRIDRRARLVPGRLVRRVIRRATNTGGVGLHVPHDDCCVVWASEALRYASPKELDAASGATDERLILLAAPRPSWIRRATEPEILSSIWRRLTHAQVHIELGQATDSGELSEDDVARFADQVGALAFDEIQTVLKHDRRVPPPGTALSVYIEFVATYVELRHLDTAQLSDTFPALENLDAVDRLIARHIDAERVVERCRPAGALAPEVLAHSIETEPDTEFIDPPIEPESSVAVAPPAHAEALRRRAAQMEQRGNAVRAAILLTRVSRRESRARSGEAAAAARRVLASLTERLQTALGFDDASATRWRVALEALRVPAAAGLRSSAARLLYDLQMVCISHERPLFEINAVDWLLSLGGRSIKRPLPNQREVQVVRHLRRARARLLRVRLDPATQQSLAGLLDSEIAHAQELLRERLRPLVHAALVKASLQVSNLPEHVALEAIIEELLDRVQERGYLIVGDVRDAVARHDIKLSDLTLHDFAHGDPLLQTDRRLAVGLDGIYRRAEVYLRGLQKASSLAFGTPVGRVLTLWLVIPFGAALATLVTAQHLVEFVQKFTLSHSSVERVSDFLTATTAGMLGVDREGSLETSRELVLLHIEPRWTTRWSVLALGLFILALMHWGGLRAAAMRCLRTLWWGVRGVFWDVPRRLASLPVVRALLQSRLWALATRWFFGPAAAAGAIWLIAGACGASVPMQAALAGAGYLLFAWGLGTRLARLAMEELSDAFARCWEVLNAELLPGIFHAIMAFFHAVLERIDQALYTVDEWLRFRSGESPATLAIKAVAGMFWSAIAYVLRLVVNLLVEPQVNPIKHFPTVTVAHKMTGPFLLLMLPKMLEAPPFGLSPVNAYTVGFTAQMLLPGVFGFLVWELKENWKLYRANRSPVLRPLVVGSHGETLPRLLRPGFHSGTLPKGYARLRKADRKGDSQSHRTRQRKRHQIHHTAEAVAAFIDRQLLTLLQQTQSLAGVPLHVEHVATATNRISVHITHRQSRDPLTIEFQEQHGWLAASVTAVPLWVSELGTAECATLSNALIGLFHRAGVDVVHEQIRASLPPAWTRYELTPGGLRAWIAGRDELPIIFELRDGKLIAEAREAQGVPPLPGTPNLIVEQLLLSHSPITWSRWVETWERERAGDAPTPLAPFDLLPTPPRLHAASAGVAHGVALSEVEPPLAH